MILVTGGSGFIGSNLVSALCARGDQVAVCDWLGCENKWRNVAKSDFCMVVAPGDVKGWLAQSETHLNAVVHLGAISSTTETDVDLIYDTNVRLSMDLWNWCATRSVPLIYASSAATYGNGAVGFADEMSSLAALRPLNPYGWSKHFFDRFVAREVATGRPLPPQHVGLKFFNVYGPNEYHKGSMQSVVAQKYPLVSSGRPVTLFRSSHPEFPDGGQMRDFIYVDDCVDVMLWLLEHPKVSGLFNLGTGAARSFSDLAKALAAAVGTAAQIEFIPMPDALRDKYQYFTEAPMERLRAAGYVRAFTSLEDGISDYVRNYLSLPDSYR